MLGVGGAMMVWRLAWLRAFPEDTKPGQPPYTPAIAPMRRALTSLGNHGSWEYYRILGRISRGLKP